MFLSTAYIRRKLSSPQARGLHSRPDEVASRFIGNRNGLHFDTECTRLGLHGISAFHPRRKMSLGCAGPVRQVTYIAVVTTGVTRQQISHLHFLKSLLFVSFLSEISFGRMDFNFQQYVVRKFEIYYGPHAAQVQQLI